MFDFPYYLVAATVSQMNKMFPVFYTCVKTKSGFEIIADLEEFLKDGKSGLSGNLLQEERIATYVKVNDTGWKSRVSSTKFF